MKKIYSLTIAAGLALSFAGCTSANTNITATSASKVDVKEICNVEKQGLKKILETAKAYNAVAVKDGVEFKRQSITNSNYIAALDAAVKSGSAKAVVNFKAKGKKKTKTFTTNYVAQRACKFAVVALQQKHEASTQWREAVPGDQYKY